MRAEYTGRYPGYVHVDGEGKNQDTDGFDMTLDEAAELWASLPEAIKDAEEAKPDLLPCPHCGAVP